MLQAVDRDLHTVVHAAPAARGSSLYLLERAMPPEIVLLRELIQSGVGQVDEQVRCR